MLGYQRDIEQGYAERIESMLERVLGPGHALARVTVVLDLAQGERTEELRSRPRRDQEREAQASRPTRAASPSGRPA